MPAGPDRDLRPWKIFLNNFFQSVFLYPGIPLANQKTDWNGQAFGARKD
jgi:hypothetical protein